MNFGSWDLAADKSANEIIKLTPKESMKMRNKEKYLLSDSKLSK
jgi:hypothetical protein